MKISLARTGGILTLLGGLASLAGFLFLPFGVDPLRFFPVNGILLLQQYTKEVSAQSMDRYAQTSPLHIALLVSSASLWTVLIIFAAITLLALFLVIRRKPGIALPIVCFLLSLFAVPGLFLTATYVSIDPDNLNILVALSRMFETHHPFIIGPGWWVSLAGLLLTLIASILTLIASFRRPQPSPAGRTLLTRQAAVPHNHS
jgi:hypothetical protein